MMIRPEDFPRLDPEVRAKVKADLVKLFEEISPEKSARAGDAAEQILRVVENVPAIVASMQGDRTAVRCLGHGTGREQREAEGQGKGPEADGGRNTGPVTHYGV